MVHGRHLLESDQAERFAAAVGTLSARLKESRADALIVFGADHFNTFQLDTMPAFCVGIGENTRSWGDANLPETDFAVRDDLARAVLAGLFDDGFDAAFAHNMRVDHAFASPLTVLELPATLPIVPIIVNCTAPPLPSARRAYDFGRSVRCAIDACGSVERVAVLGTGGLSHTVPIPQRARSRARSSAR